MIRQPYDPQIVFHEDNESTILYQREEVVHMQIQHMRWKDTTNDLFVKRTDFGKTTGLQQDPKNSSQQVYSLEVKPLLWRKENLREGLQQSNLFGFPQFYLYKVQQVICPEVKPPLLEDEWL